MQMILISPKPLDLTLGCACTVFSAFSALFYFRFIRKNKKKHAPWSRCIIPLMRISCLASIASSVASIVFTIYLPPGVPFVFGLASSFGTLCEALTIFHYQRKPHTKLLLLELCVSPMLAMVLSFILPSAILNGHAELGALRGIIIAQGGFYIMATKEQYQSGKWRSSDLITDGSSRWHFADSYRYAMFLILTVVAAIPCALSAATTLATFGQLLVGPFTYFNCRSLTPDAETLCGRSQTSSPPSNEHNQNVDLSILVYVNKDKHRNIIENPYEAFHTLLEIMPEKLPFDVFTDSDRTTIMWKWFELFGRQKEQVREDAVIFSRILLTPTLKLSLSSEAQNAIKEMKSPSRFSMNSTGSRFKFWRNFLR